MSSYVEPSTPAIVSRTSFSAVEQGPWTDVKTVVSSTTEVFFEVANTVDSDTIITISGFDPLVIDTYTVSTLYYDGTAWNQSYTYDNSFPTAGSIGTVEDNGQI